jgi:hypothetical protein
VLSGEATNTIFIVFGLTRGDHATDAHTLFNNWGKKQRQLSDILVKSKKKDWLAQNQDNVSEWGEMSICGLLFQ